MSERESGNRPLRIGRKFLAVLALRLLREREDLPSGERRYNCALRTIPIGIVSCEADQREGRCVWATFLCWVRYGMRFRQQFQFGIGRQAHL
jgi:hypothetical protein